MGNPLTSTQHSLASAFDFDAGQPQASKDLRAALAAPGGPMLWPKIPSIALNAL